jgi:predicted phosphodiesterase
VYARRSFDLGPAFGTYRSLTLDLEAAGRWVAWLNGVRMQGGDGGSATLNVPAGLLRARENVLAIELHATTPVSSLRIAPRLAGDRRHEDLRVTEGPYLLAPAPDAITVAWETGVAVSSSVVVDGRRFDGGNQRHHVVRVGGLAPSTSYRYHVETGAASTEEAELRTAPLTAERVRFVVYGDNRTNGDAHRRVVEAIAGESPDFLLNTGDLVASAREDEWRTFFDIEYPVLLTTPIFPALGNHETYSHGGEGFTQLFPLGDASRFGGRVYSADYGAVHVAVLDSNGDLEAQARWLDQDLTRAEKNGAKHSFVMLHWGPFSGRKAIMHGSNGAARSYVVPVARAHRVDAIFSGHDHLYERGSSGDLAYFVTGGGGAPLVRTGTCGETVHAASIYHYVVVDVSGSEVRVQAKDPAGVTFDEVRLGHAPDRVARAR